MSNFLRCLEENVPNFNILRICLANINSKLHPHKNTIAVIDIFNLVKILNPSVGGTCNTREIALAGKNFSIFYRPVRTHISPTHLGTLRLAFSISAVPI